MRIFSNIDIYVIKAKYKWNIRRGYSVINGVHQTFTYIRIANFVHKLRHLRDRAYVGPKKDDMICEHPLISILHYLLSNTMAHSFSTYSLKCVHKTCPQRCLILWPFSKSQEKCHISIQISRYTFHFRDKPTFYKKL